MNIKNLGNHIDLQISSVLLRHVCIYSFTSTEMKMLLNAWMIHFKEAYAFEILHLKALFVGTEL